MPRTRPAIHRRRDAPARSLSRQSNPANAAKAISTHCRLNLVNSMPGGITVTVCLTCPWGYGDSAFDLSFARATRPPRDSSSAIFGRPRPPAGQPARRWGDASLASGCAGAIEGDDHAGFRRRLEDPLGRPRRGSPIERFPSAFAALGEGEKGGDVEASARGGGLGGTSSTNRDCADGARERRPNYNPAARRSASLTRSCQPGPSS
jgi:hypothetical protein